MQYFSPIRKDHHEQLAEGMKAIVTQMKIRAQYVKLNQLNKAQNWKAASADKSEVFRELYRSDQELLSQLEEDWSRAMSKISARTSRIRELLRHEPPDHKAQATQEMLQQEMLQQELLLEALREVEWAHLDVKFQAIKDYYVAKRKDRSLCGFYLREEEGVFVLLEQVLGDKYTRDKENLRESKETVDALLACLSQQDMVVFEGEFESLNLQYQTKLCAPKDEKSVGAFVQVLLDGEKKQIWAPHDELVADFQLRCLDSRELVAPAEMYSTFAISVGMLAPNKKLSDYNLAALTLKFEYINGAIPVTDF